MHDVDYGLELASEHFSGNTSHIVARNNLIYSCHTAGISIGGYDLKRGKTEDTTIVNNTLYNNDAWETGTGEILMQFLSAQQRVQEQHHLRGQTWASHEQPIRPHGWQSDGGLRSQPLLLSWRFEELRNGVTTAGNSRVSKNMLQASGNDQHSRFADPEFVDAASGNFHLQGRFSRPKWWRESWGRRLVGDEDLDGLTQACRSEDRHRLL